MSAYSRPYLALCAALILFGCAQQQAPLGGEKDVTPPRILRSDPQNKSTNFTGNSIELEFDEYVKLKSANQELIVSPPLKYPVEFKLRNKKLFVSWRDTLLDSSTYLFQFGGGIVDVNEDNPLDSNLFVFSTGSYIDSFRIEGSVIDAFTLEPVEGIWVMLYKDLRDSVPYLESPRYFSKTDKEGNFVLDYLQEGRYKIFALGTVNSGYTYDVPGESIAFKSDPIPAQPTSQVDTSYRLELFIEIDSTQYLKEFDQLGERGIVLGFNRPVETITITDLTAITDVSAWTESWTPDLDSVTYWFPERLEYDSLKLRVEVVGFEDTIFFRKPRPKATKGRGAKKDGPERLNLQSSAGSKQPFFKPWFIRSETPLDRLDQPERLIFTEGEDTVDIQPYLKKEFYELKVDYPWKESIRYRLLMPDSTVYDRFGLTQDTLSFDFTTSRKEDYGILVVNHELPDHGHPYIWQLLKSDGKLVDERVVKPKGKIEYPHLLTGNYQVRIMYDQQQNGVWDPGYYPAKRQPEKVRFYDEKIEVRSNWTTEVSWQLVD